MKSRLLLGRRLDYWAIAVSTAFLQRELDPKLPKWVTGASLAVTPFRPFVVSAGNTTALEVCVRILKLRKISYVQNLLIEGETDIMLIYFEHVVLPCFNCALPDCSMRLA